MSLHGQQDSTARVIRGSGRRAARGVRGRWQGPAASLAVHALLLALVILSTTRADFDGRPAEGAGGAGPAGGGGGSSPLRGGGERVQFVAVRPPPPPLPPAAVPADVVQVAPPQPVVQPPVTERVAAVTEGVSASAGDGAGAGTGGSGPGTGGGVGSGIGTGRGSGVGPGTGGGTGQTHPPTPTQFFLPPLPAPERIKPYHLIAWFDVDERGNATLLGFNPSRDAGYNRRLRDVLLTLRFRPGVRDDGTPVRDTVDIHYIF